MRLQILITLCALLLHGCQQIDGDDDNGGPPTVVNPGAQPVLAIGAVSQYTFWGEIMTITGTGFSTNASDNIVTFDEVYQTAVPARQCVFSSRDGILVVEEATPTELKVRVPVCSRYGELEDGINYCRGVTVQVNDKQAVYGEVVYFLGGPYLESVCANGPRFSPGDSTYITIDLEGSKRIESVSEAGYEVDDIRIWLDGIPMNYTTMEAASMSDLQCNKLTILFAIETPMSLATNECTDSRRVPLVVHIDGTSQFDTTEVDVKTNPYQEIYSVKTTTDDENFSFSKGDGLQVNRGLIVKGRNMRAIEIVYSRGQDTVTVSEGCHYCDEFEHTVPVDLLDPGTYKVHFKDWCGVEAHLHLPFIKVVE